ncbi:MAG: PorV/PorQ family protein [Bacteroidota bacterium]|nr:PorV/PorQ family protein [Bacteroidota bacterium]
MGILLLFFFWENSGAQTVRAYAGEFLQLGTGARSLARGGAAIATIDDASAGYWNPAGLSQLQYPSITGMHEARFDNTVQHDFAALAFPLGKDGGAAISVMHIGISNIKDTRSALIDLNGDGLFNGDDYIDYSKVTSFGNFDWGILLSYGQKKDSLFSYGATVKVIFRKLDADNHATGFGIDLGARYHITPQLTLAAVGQDITTTLLSYTTGTKELVSPTLKIGAAYLWDIFSDMSHTLMPAIDADIRFENLRSISEVHVGPMSSDFHFGLEYQFQKLIALRAGYSDLKMVTIGAGVRLPRLSIDYAFQSFNAQDQLGNTHRVSFSLNLEQAKWKRGN